MSFGNFDSVIHMTHDYKEDTFCKALFIKRVFGNLLKVQNIYVCKIEIIFHLWEYLTFKLLPFEFVKFRFVILSCPFNKHWMVFSTHVKIFTGWLSTSKPQVISSKVIVPFYHIFFIRLYFTTKVHLDIRLVFWYETFHQIFHDLSNLKSNTFDKTNSYCKSPCFTYSCIFASPHSWNMRRNWIDSKMTRSSGLMKMKMNCLNKMRSVMNLKSIGVFDCVSFSNFISTSLTLREILIVNCEIYDSFFLLDSAIFDDF